MKKKTAIIILLSLVFLFTLAYGVNYYLYTIDLGDWEQQRIYTHIISILYIRFGFMFVFTVGTILVALTKNSYNNSVFYLILMIYGLFYLFNIYHTISEVIVFEDNWRDIINYESGVYWNTILNIVTIVTTYIIARKRYILTGYSNLLFILVMVFAFVYGLTNVISQTDLLRLYINNDMKWGISYGILRNIANFVQYIIIALFGYVLLSKEEVVEVPLRAETQTTEKKKYSNQKKHEENTGFSWDTLSKSKE